MSCADCADHGAIVKSPVKVSGLISGVDEGIRV
jgi:hypothetical protein